MRTTQTANDDATSQQASKRQLRLRAVCPDCGNAVERAGWTCGECVDEEEDFDEDVDEDDTDNEPAADTSDATDPRSGGCHVEAD